MIALEQNAIQMPDQVALRDLWDTWVWRLDPVPGFPDSNSSCTTMALAV